MVIPTPEQIAEWTGQIKGLETALGSGVLEVWFKGRRETYRSTSEIMNALSYFKGKLAAATAGDAVLRRTTIIQSDV